jgi:succinate dehydrogenase / fumarate reductase flavoprotein subunit
MVFGARAGRHAAGGDMEAAKIETGKTDDAETGEVDSPVPLGEVGIDDGVAADGGATTATTPSEVVEATLEAERERIETLLEKEDGVHHAKIREEVQQTMTDHVNVFREKEGLKQALADIREAREHYQDVTVQDPSRTYNTDLIQTIETRNILDLAEAITVGALARDEFRGAHWRKEHQERDDENWLKHTMLSWNDGDPELWFKSVVLEGESKTYEPKIRSY